MQSSDDGPRLTRAEYWLLNQVVTLWCPIRFLVHPDPKALFNNPGHGLSRDRLVLVLADRFDRGWIVAHRNGPSAFQCSLTPIEIAAALDQKMPPPSERASETLDAILVYGLTEQGSAAWEAFACPDWDRFMEVEYSDHCTIFGANESRIKDFISAHHTGLKVKPETVEWQTFHPWDATYWKQLPVGYQVQFDCVEVPNRSAMEVDHLRSLTRWYDWE